MARTQYGLRRRTGRFAGSTPAADEAAEQLLLLQEQACPSPDPGARIAFRWRKSSATPHRSWLGMRCCCVLVSYYIIVLDSIDPSSVA